MLKTENLVILFTDIAGFTEATSFQSREQNQRILDTHNALLLPIVKRFHGRHIKSVGDALLLAFTSPTEAMRCAMAMQDALHAYNRTAPQGEEIHIRIAASLGEVRVSKGDIFGEPVNVTSRIEGITPADEIYFSEAVYLAMNKAEVPAVEIGLQELKGISKPVRIFSIPRFANSQLVPEAAAAGDINTEISFPFGGMHLSAAPVSTPWMGRMQQASSRRFRDRTLLKWSTATAIVGLSIIVATQFVNVSVDFGTPDADANSAAAPAAAPPQPTAAQPTVAQPPAAPQTTPASLSLPSAPAATPAQAPAAAVIQSSPPRPAISSIAQAKRAYRDARISKERYREIVRKLEDDLDLYIRRAKIDYNEGRISKETYRNRVESLKRRYVGE
jgi:adenylate cyclase